MKNPKGFTLVELLIGATLSLFLLGGLSAFLVATHVFFKKQHQEADFQERLRYAFYMMGRDIENAGFLGCANARSKDADVRFDSLSEEETLYYPNPITLQSSLDAMWVSYAMEKEKEKEPPEGVTVRVASSCAKTVVFADNKSTLKKVEQYFTKADEEIRTQMPMRLVHYFLDGDHGLYRKELGDRSEELVPHIRNMLIIPGIDEGCNGTIVYRVKPQFPIEPYKISALTVQLEFMMADTSITSNYERTFLLNNRCFVGT